jgi:urease accessory protein
MPDTSILPEPDAIAPPAGWRAELALGFESADGRTVLARRHHAGPLVVQKPLYPEGGEVCHAIVVHPPGGIAGGDHLHIAIDANVGSRVLVTTPGAAKWYKANGRDAAQDVRIAIADGALVEWLPQETIVFDGARARLSLEIELAENARYLGWDITVLGRQASGEHFDSGSLRQRTVMRRAGREIFAEAARVEGGDALLASPAGFAGCHVTGTLIAAGAICSEEVLRACRELAPQDGAKHALTRLPGALLARYLGRSPQSAREYFADLWAALRPWLAGREACMPRIWRT